MPTKIRLSRRGKKKKPLYDILVADSRAPRDGRYIEKLGQYNPMVDPAGIVLDEDKAFDWVMKGAQPTEVARRILSRKGIMYKKHLQVGVDKGAISQEDADKKYADWKADKDAKEAALLDDKQKALAAKLKALEEERQKIREDSEKAKAEAEAAKVAEATAAVEAEKAEAAAEEAPAEAPAEEEAPKAEAPVEEKKAEAPAEEPKAEAKEEPKAEAKEEPKAEEKKEEAPAAEAKEEKKAE
jgi:small subunit ribosomal protein S16